jgi:nucleotide-binding universal stress UspA family protein
MNTFRHIVVAYDGQDESQAALRTGIDLSKQLASRLTIVHVYQEEHAMHTRGIQPVMPNAPANGYLNNNLQNYPVAPDPSHQLDQTHTQHDYFDNADEMVSRIRMKMDENQAIGEIEILSGSPSDAILDYAKEKNADLIVMGSRDSGGLKKLLFGGVSDKVSHNSAISVLIAK